MADKSTEGNGSKDVRISIPEWLAVIGKQSPLALVLLVILYIFRLDGREALHDFGAQQKEARGEFTKTISEARVDFLRALDKLETQSKDRTDKLIQSFDELKRILEKRDKKKDGEKN